MVGSVLRPLWLRPLCLLLLAVLAACSGPSKPVPKELGSNIGLIGVKSVWTAQVGPVEAFAAPRIVGQQVLLASSSGVVLSLIHI